jgi:RNA polymerase sigma factor (sigma-70 family)
VDILRAVTTDAELVRAWAAGDERAGLDLYRRHVGAVVRFFRNKVADRDRNDLLQSTFMTCFQHADRYEPNASFRAFLLAIANNVLRNHYRTWSRKGEKIDFGVSSIRELGVSPSGFIAKRQEERQLIDALTSLPLEHQILLELFYWERMDGREIAEFYGVPEGTVRTRLRRARQLLLEALQGAELPDAHEARELVIDTWARSIREQLDEGMARDRQ